AASTSQVTCRSLMDRSPLGPRGVCQRFGGPRLGEAPLLLLRVRGPSAAYTSTVDRSPCRVQRLSPAPGPFGAWGRTAVPGARPGEDGRTLPQGAIGQRPGCDLPLGSPSSVTCRAVPEPFLPRAMRWGRAARRPPCPQVGKTQEGRPSPEGRIGP